MLLPAGVGRLKIFFCSLSFQRLTEEESHTPKSLFDHRHRVSKVESELASTLLAPKSLRLVTVAMKLKDTYSLKENLG